MVNIKELLKFPRSTQKKDEVKTSQRNKEMWLGQCDSDLEIHLKIEGI